MIALIVTIILMLILVSVTINGVIDGGLFKYAGKAKNSTEIASEKEILKTAIIIAKGTSKSGTISEEELQKAIDEATNEGTAKVYGEENSNVVKFEESNRFYEIDKKSQITGPIDIVIDETPGQFDGKGTKDDPYVIMSIEDLVYFSMSCDYSVSYYSGKYFVLGRNLDFNSKLSYVDYTTKEFDEYLGGDGTTELMTQLGEAGKGFKAIGAKTIYKPFSGTFDGNGYEIKNIYLSTAFFQHLTDANVSNVILKGKSKVGYGLTQTMLYSKVDNCYIDVEMTGRNCAGISTTCTDSSIINCCNKGNATGFWGEYVAGIVGYCKGNNYIYNCYNLGNMNFRTDNSKAGVAGIVGNVSSGVTNIINCYNTGYIYLTNYGYNDLSQKKGVIVGRCEDGAEVVIKNCYHLDEETASIFGTKITEDQMKNKEKIEDKYIIDILNEYVNEYNTENSNEKNFKELKHWKVGEKGYPVFE